MTRPTLAILLIMLSTPVLSGTNLWLAPLSSLTASNAGEKDFMKLFDVESNWATVSRSIGVFKLYPYFVGRASDADLKQIFRFLGQHHISLALEARALTATIGCEMPNGGDGGKSTVHLLQRIKRLGGVADFLAMDEPLKHGLAGEAACKASVEQIVQDAFSNALKAREVFPDLEIGDIEPVGTWRNSPNLLYDILNFIDMYDRISDKKLAFMHADIGWSTPWISITNKLEVDVRDRGIRFGIIYNGNDMASSDQEWSSQAVAHFEQYEDCSGTRPDDAVIQSWRQHPSRTLPESDPNTLTGVARRYIVQKRC